jgi:hypothetical protein
MPPSPSQTAFVPAIPADYQQAGSFYSPVTCVKKSTKMGQEALKAPTKPKLKSTFFDTSGQ